MSPIEVVRSATIGRVSAATTGRRISPRQDRILVRPAGRHSVSRSTASLAGVGGVSVAEIYDEVLSGRQGACVQHSAAMNRCSARC
jgi:hypothetical protein